MLGNPKNVFWEALLLTIIVFIFGMLLGVVFESRKVDKINEYYLKSEIFLMDVLALNNMIDLENNSCDELILHNINLADRIYEEAYLLEKYEDAKKISDTIRFTHQKYDIARTFLWINNMKVIEKCEKNFHSVVYLYEYETKDLAKKATQKIWSKILFDLKQEKGNEIILIPIAVDSNLASLDSLIEEFNLSNFPVVIIDDEHVIEELSSLDDLGEYLD